MRTLCAAHVDHCRERPVAIRPRSPRAHFAEVPIRFTQVTTRCSGQEFVAAGGGAAGTNLLRRFRVPVCFCDSVYGTPGMSFAPVIVS